MKILTKKEFEILKAKSDPATSILPFMQYDAYVAYIKGMHPDHKKLKWNPRKNRYYKT